MKKSNFLLLQHSSSQKFFFAFMRYEVTLTSEGKRVPGGRTEGQSPDGVVVSQEASVGQQAERPVRLPHL